jgi:capsular polysaccharide biosynthesis protein
MELKSYLQIIKQQKKVIFITAVLIGFFAFIFSFFAPTIYETSLSIETERKNIQETSDFRYDDYYALKASEMFVDSMAKWFSNPEFIIQIYKKAEVDISSASLRNLKKKIKANKMSAQYLEIKFKANTRKESEKISSAISSTIKERSKSLGWTEAKENIFSIKTNEPIIVEKNPLVFLNTLIGLFSGLFIGILIGFFRKYLE